ncbi:carboxypeptidase regulatory-like domain-containing protein [Pedobacter sp. PF22-3]|uniref:TonB-dependent receptor n=1 Tax=Pedobacter sp. PF22-3 TaxID=2994467 RepID=UPI002246DB1B|nr:carboxypeptidase regulatory-like domain-containing protein [Pedobacter sp. PF22-3]MCX2495101.1 carboxypeptidase regulatory-like domain-containing protein [Pedobacter sp. PF22-3]
MKSRILSLVSILVLLVTFAQAQVTTSSINGKIKDSKGIIPGATIVMVHVPTGTVSKGSSNESGLYRIGNLNPGGPYKITVTFVGYSPVVKENIYLTLGSDLKIDLDLQEQGNQLADVSIKGQKGGTKSGAGTSIGEGQIKTLPTMNRSLQDVTRVTPQGSKDNTFGGTNFRYNNVTIDGAINNDAIGFSPSLGGQSGSSGMPGSSTRTNPVSLDAIQDVTVLLSPYDVKVGNFLGGSINAVTRGGTNEVVGSVYGYGRNASLIGRNKIGDNAKEPSAFHDYQTGFRVGFPIIKDKLFFFTNEEITRRQDPVILGAGSSDMKLLTLSDAQKISDRMKNAYGIDAGSFGDYNIYSQSNKFFNRLDWNISESTQLTIRNNTIVSKATNLERDQSNFRFGGIDFKQNNNQSSTVADLKTRFGNSATNNLILGYSTVHDFRTPLSDPAIPQIEIGSNGGTIFLGTDREASIFNMKQNTFELTDNYSFSKGIHNFTVGTHNEFYKINYGFVNAWNGRVAYDSVDDFLNNKPKRVRTSFDYADNTRDNIIANPTAKFNVNLYSAYGQDEMRLSDKFKLTLGLRFDMADLPTMPTLSSKTTNSPVDPNYGTTYTYTQPSNINNKFLNKVQISPRLGFNFDALGDQSLIVRGGSGLFTSRVPFAWLGYAYYNNGVNYGSYDLKPATGNKVVTQVPGTDPIKDALGGNGEAGYAAKQGVNINDANGATQVDLVDNNFKMPKAWRSNLAFDFKTQDNWKFTVEGIYSKVIKDVAFQQINYVDNPKYMVYDTQKQQPIYSTTSGAYGNGKINNKYTNAYLLSNTDQGYKYSLTGQISKSLPFGLDVMVAYTYGQSKDIANGIRNSMESNWQLNQALSPNNPGLAYSNFDIRNRIISTINYRLDWAKNGKYVSNFSLFFSGQSGSPYSLGLVNSTINGTGQTVSLMYIPAAGETQKFFANTADGIAQAAAFDSYVNGDKYLSTRRGNFTERNGARTPWNVQADFRLSQDIFVTGTAAKKHTLTLTYDIVNLTNLLNKDWGVQYFSPNTYNSMASIGLTQAKDAAGKVLTGSPTTYPTYTFSQAGVSSYSKDFFASRYQMQLGLRYSF